MESDHLTTFQVEVARIFFGLKASSGYLVAGGAALLASDLIARPTEDLQTLGSSVRPKRSQPPPAETSVSEGARR